MEVVIHDQSSGLCNVDGVRRANRALPRLASSRIQWLSDAGGETLVDGASTSCVCVGGRSEGIVSIQRGLEWWL